jgi:hypothetical protein
VKVMSLQSQHATSEIVKNVMSLVLLNENNKRIENTQHLSIFHIFFNYTRTRAQFVQQPGQRILNCCHTRKSGA